MKKALIVTSFGTSYPETRKKTIEAIEQRMAEHFADFQIFRAFTSNKVIKKIKDQEGQTIPTVDQLVRKLNEDGYQEVLMQPLHIINGSEYSKALHQAKQYRADFSKMLVGKPLLTDFEDYRYVADWLIQEAQSLTDREVLILMGHGSQHAAFPAYACLDHLLMEQPIYICAVESYPEISSVVKRLKKEKVKKIRLCPLMLVAGDHATNDMASDDPDSWKSQLENEGFSVQTVLKGLGEYPLIQDRFIQHAENAWERGK